ncbi:hypothetical protein NA57DRAFT_71382 [Rhizodiscina lignyota]|uniref:Uncharacterized protein n=1 Tax=Rhizodiscina lignyota TaxID=1504668 RepID=A0A9P4IIQ9_9PEZI|nr:hypothetical protein NA57DRAFT_71382 [Rhizodiscina lignyota]
MGTYMFVDVVRYSQRYFNETIKAADVVLIVNRRKNTTRTETHFIDLPEGYTRPPVDSAGSAIFTVTTDFNNNGTTVITFPTEYTLYDSSYSFNGTLATTTTGGDAVCKRAPNGTTVTLPSHPQPGPTTFPPDIYSYVGNKDISIPFPKGGDTRGVFYTTYYDQIDETDFYQSVFPGEAAFKSCNWPLLPAPATILDTAYLLTDTSVSYEDDEPATPPPGRKTDQDTSSSGGHRATPHLAHTEATVPTSPETKPTAGGGGGGKGQASEGANSQSEGNNGDGLAGAIASAASAARTATTPKTTATAAAAHDSQDNNQAGGIAGVIASAASNAQPQNSPGRPAQAQDTPNSPAQPTATPARTIVQNGVTVSADNGGHLVAGGQTLTPGSTVFVTPSSGASPVPVVIQTTGGSGSGSGSGSGGGSGPKGDSGSNDGSGSNGGSGSGNSGGSGSGSGSRNGNTVLVIGGSTTTLSSGAFESLGSTPAGASLVPQPIVVGGITFTPTATAPGAAPTAFVISGQTLAPSHPITVGSGSDTTVVALTTNAAGSSVLVVGSSTSVLPTPTPGSGTGSGSAQSTIGIGDYIISALGGSVASSIEAAGSITAAVFTVPASGTRRAETVTAVEISSGVFVIPGVNGQPARTITVGGEDVTIDDVEVSAVGTGVVIEGNGKKTTVGVSTDAVETGSTGPQSTTGFVQFEGAASEMIGTQWDWVMILCLLFTAARELL